MRWRSTESCRRLWSCSPNRGQPREETTTHLDKQFVLDELKKEGQSEKVQHALQTLPDKIDHEQHAALLTKLGLDPGKLVEKAAERGIASL